MFKIVVQPIAFKEEQLLILVGRFLSREAGTIYFLFFPLRKVLISPRVSLLASRVSFEEVTINQHGEYSL